MIKKGLKVRVLTGKDKKKEGEVIEIDRVNNRAKVKEINMVKKHVKTTKEKKGGIFPKESFIHISNLKLIDEKAAKKKGGRSEEHTLNSSHITISYAVFCLKKKKKIITFLPILLSSSISIFIYF